MIILRRGLIFLFKIIFNKILGEVKVRSTLRRISVLFTKKCLHFGSDLKNKSLVITKMFTIKIHIENLITKYSENCFFAFYYHYHLVSFELVTFLVKAAKRKSVFKRRSY